MGTPASSKVMRVMLTGDSKLAEGVNVSMNDGLSLCDCLAIDSRPAQGVHCLSPRDSW